VRAPIRTHRSAFGALWLLLAACAAQSAPLSDVVKAPRPKGGEHFGLYLMNKKVGHVFTDVALVEGASPRVKATTQFVFKANVGNRVSERLHREVRTYEATPKGKLLEAVIEQRGDGGDQTVRVRRTAEGMTAMVERPGRANQELKLPASDEVVEDADQVRVALLRGKPVAGKTLDGTDLQSYPVTTTPKGMTERVVGGVKVQLLAAVTISEKEKVPVEAFLAKSGETVEIHFGETMKAVAEPQAVAKRLDQVEVFGLTRIVLPRILPETATAIPGQLQLVVTGLPEKFHKATARQSYRKLGGDKVEVTLKAAAPKATAALPLKDPEGGENLESTLIVEAENPEIVKLSKELVGEEKNAYAASLKIFRWVHQNLEKDYGASADRASDVLRQKKGDCTEHSLLTVALLRAAGIPARRIDGVVYLRTEDKVPALYWHEWVEAYVGEWTQLDPTFGQAVADATHLALGAEGNAEITPLIGALKVAEVKSP
jgi:hypothetical protein